MAEQAQQKTDVIPRNSERQVQTALQNPNPTTMVQYALENGFDLERLDRILEMERRSKEERAREAFNEALAAWKKNPPKVVKDKTNKHYGNSYTSIGNQVNTVTESMAPYGLSTDWTLEQDDNGRITVTCTLTHTLGHTKKSTLSGPPDTSGSKNALQQIKSTVTYLEIATHQAVTGIVAFDGANLDDDGTAANLNVITAGQVKTIERLIKETKTDKAKFLTWASEGSTEVSQIPAAKFAECMQMLTRKKQEQAKPPANAES